MLQLSIFDDLEKENKIYEVLSKAKEYDNNLKVAAVYIPDPEMSLAEPSFAVKENGKYKFYEILHGHILFRGGPLGFRDELPNKFWSLVAN
jgi:lysyl-tRNA synthetase class I